jgi:hypothetical protein
MRSATCASQNSFFPQINLLNISTFQDKGFFFIVPIYFQCKGHTVRIGNIFNITDGRGVNLTLDIIHNRFAFVGTFAPSSRISDGFFATQNESLEKINVVHLLDIHCGHGELVIQQKLAPFFWIEPLPVINQIN